MTFRNPFKIGSVPRLAANYSRSVWHQLGFFFRQRWPGQYVGTFYLNRKEIQFNAKNTQFEAVYVSSFSSGYEPEVMAVLDLIVGKSDVFWDVGSNWGYFSLFVASKKGFGGKVYAFEPFPTTYEDLVDVVAQSGLNGNIECVPLALSNQEGEAEMKFSGILQSGFALITKTDAGIFNPRARVTTKTIDSLRISPPNVIKIDAQFHEKEIIEGGAKTLSAHKPYLIFENCLDFELTEKTSEPLRLLENLGYKFFFPCWNSGTLVVSSEVGSAGKLTMRPIISNERFLYRDTINIVACHKTRLGQFHRLVERQK